MNSDASHGQSQAKPLHGRVRMASASFYKASTTSASAPTAFMNSSPTPS
eukprot:CAMPEP_0179010490 /NCGR_PEP_ID=MMETSP0796-20121207/141_1 /TAXON_ID=73915 /ORGANISM="Pyrodinium bahamense, Strain pbaha01" /LENGTH=48 /DNA_ID= /DNA_START= /DNA_END= /DNA_ORIENTATION=